MMRIIKIAVISSMMLLGCAEQQMYEGKALPESETALLGAFSGHSLIIFERHLSLLYLDGKDNLPPFGDKRVMPGKHRLGIFVNWGNFCPPGPAGSACFNNCYSGLVLNAKAGRKYSYDMEKQQDILHVVVSDDTGDVVAKEICESVSMWSSTLHSPVIKSINERLEKEPK